TPQDELSEITCSPLTPIKCFLLWVTRGACPPNQFRLRLKTYYQDVSEEMRFVEFAFVAAFVDIRPNIRVNDAHCHQLPLPDEGRSRSLRTCRKTSSTSKSAVISGSPAKSSREVNGLTPPASARRSTSARAFSVWRSRSASIGESVIVVVMNTPPFESHPMTG